MPHRGQQLAHDDPPAAGDHRPVEALLHGRDHLVEGQPGLDVLLGGVADLGVDDAVGGQVLDALAGHPGHRRTGLHHADGVVEGLQVALQRAGVGGLGEPRRRATRRSARHRRRAADDRSRRPGRRSSGAAARRRGGRAAAPSAPGGPGPAVGVMRRSFQTARSGLARLEGMRIFTDSRRGGRRRRRGARHHRVAEIDQARVNLFADATDDHQWIHVDVERATDGPFGGTIAHGYLTLSLIPYLGSQVSASRPRARSSTTASTRSASPTRSRSASGSAPTSPSPTSRTCPRASRRPCATRSRSRARPSPPASPRPSSSCSPDRRVGPRSLSSERRSPASRAPFARELGFGRDQGPTDWLPGPNSRGKSARLARESGPTRRLRDPVDDQRGGVVRAADVVAAVERGERALEAVLVVGEQREAAAGPR